MSRDLGALKPEDARRSATHPVHTLQPPNEQSSRGGKDKHLYRSSTTSAHPHDPRTHRAKTAHTPRLRRRQSARHTSGILIVWSGPRRAPWHCDSVPSWTPTLWIVPRCRLFRSAAVAPVLRLCSSLLLRRRSDSGKDFLRLTWNLPPSEPHRPQHNWKNWNVTFSFGFWDHFLRWKLRFSGIIFGMRKNPIPLQMKRFERRVL
ncbi:uncharacterized protein LOC129456653 [Periophthalmus magnuspinnatus]|uniref:uncharacterized protein LOC129456653 n=1 Tax=Periophthalmus magnuspinnatus TaxID=409849 RepID=UPI002436D68F|nr:uncharacterized protein LOC129456653 [Periophthalmus magnuspinnatus]